MQYRHTKTARWIALLVGCICVTFGSYGFFHAVKASLSYKAYKRIKYGHFTGTPMEIAPARSPTEVLPACERMMALYPHNYYAAVLAAHAAFMYALEDHESHVKERWIRTAQYWDDMGMRLNPYNVEIYSTHARILQKTGKPLEASRFWREEVLGIRGEFGEPDNTLRRGEFWNPDRHDTMAELYLHAGQLDRAVAELDWVRDPATRNRIRTREQQHKAILRLRNQQ